MGQRGGASDRHDRVAQLHARPRQNCIDPRRRRLAAAALGYRLGGPPRFGFAVPPPAAGDAMPGRPYLVFVHATSRADKLWPEAHFTLDLSFCSSAGILWPDARVAEWQTRQT